MLVPDPIFALDIIVLTHELQEFKSSSVSDNTLFIVDLFINCNWLEHIFSQHVFLCGIVEIIVINSRS